MQSSNRNVFLSQKQSKFTLPGIIAAIMFACGPFMYATFNGRGLFFYLAIPFCLSIPLQALFFSSGKRITLKPSLEMLQTFFPFCFLTFWQAFSFLWSPTFYIPSMYAFIKVILFFFLLSLPVYTKWDKRLMVVGQTIMVCVATYLMITQAETIMESGSERITFSFFGVHQDPNYLAYFFVIPTLFIFSGILSKKTPLTLRIVLILLLLFLLYGILCTGSRGSILGICFGLLVYFICKKRMPPWKIILVITIFLLLFWGLLTIGVKYLPQSVAERFSFDVIAETGGANRTNIWRRYLSIIIKSPQILLVGAGNSAGRHTTGVSAHNYFIENWHDYGLIGLGVLFYFFYSMMRLSLKRKKPLSFSALVAALAIGFFLSVGKMVPYWLCITLANILILPDKGEEAAEAPTENQNNNTGGTL